MIALRKPQSGFTLVELVLVIVLLGIIGAASTRFVRQGVEIYSDSVVRDNLQQQGRFAVERVSRELRNALPGSVRVGGSAGSTQCIEFMPVKAASSYLEPAAGSARTTLEAVDFSYSFSGGDLLAIYPIDTASVYGPSAVLASLSNVSSLAGNRQQLQFSSFTFPYESPTQRLFIVDQPVSFCVVDNALTRHSGYTRTIAQSMLPGISTPVAENIRIDDSGAFPVFQFTAGTTYRSGVAQLDFRFSNAVQDEWVRFHQQVFQRNTP